MRRNHCAFLLPFCVLAATALLAQVIVTSTIVGTVTDPQGAVVPGAEITLTNVDTGVQWKATTNANGDYQFPNLIAAHYKVGVAKEGFAHTISTAVALENGTNQRINLGLKLGQAMETVNVSSAAAIIKTDDANVSGVIENKFVRDLPMEGRNYLNFAQIVPNFSSGTGDVTRNGWNPDGTKIMNVGGTEYGVGYYIDGLNNNDNWTEGSISNVNADTIQEVKAEVSNYSAEYGRDVGQISVTTKSGTNNLHGSVYDAFQNAGMNANAPYDIYQGVPRSAYHSNQYGFTVGGPVYIPKVFNGRNKLFFFASFERWRKVGVQQITDYVPTDAERGNPALGFPGGDFSSWLQLCPNYPDTTNCKYVIYDPTTYNPATGLRTPFPGNKISSQILATPASQIAMSYLSHFPEPNGYSSSEPGDFNNWSGTQTIGVDSRNYTARADYNIGSHDFVYFRYSRDTGEYTQTGGLVPEVALGSHPHHTSVYQTHYVHSFSPTLNNELNFSWLRSGYTSADPSQANAFGKSWLPALFQNTSTNMAGFTSFDKSLLGISNDATFGVDFAGDGLGNDLGLGSDEYFYGDLPTFQLTDNVSKTVGKHTLKAGYYMARRTERDNDVVRHLNIGFDQGNGYSDTNYTAQGPYAQDGSGWNKIAEFETGFIGDMAQRTPVTNGDASLNFAMPEYAAYFGDTWNATRKLTLTLGMRYDLPIPVYGVHNYWTILDQTYPGWRMVMPGLTPGTKAHPFSAPKKDFAPRIGLAYRLDDKTVVRSGYGIFYETGRFKFMDQVFWSGPGYGGSDESSYLQTGDPGMTHYTLSDAFQPTTTYNRGSYPYPLGDDGGLMWTPGNAVTTATLDQKSWTTPYDQRWSLDVQRELGKAVVATVGYVGSEGTHLPIQYDLNLPPQGTYFTTNVLDAARPQSAVAPGRWGEIDSVRANRSNNYHAMNAELKVRGWHGVTSQVSYTWSKQMDNFFGENGEGGTHAIGGQWHPNWSYGPSDADHTHRFVAAVTYELPGKHVGNRLLREAIGGWQINSITTFESGSPFAAGAAYSGGTQGTVTNGYTSSYDYMGDVPIQNCNGNLPRGDRTFTRAFNTDCYVEPAASTDPYYTSQGIYNYAVTRGNEHRNNLRQPGINNWDMGLQKSWYPFGEGRELQFRADSFNVFNHTQWSSFDTYDDRIVSGAESQFGFITASRPGRHMQLNMRFVF